MNMKSFLKNAFAYIFTNNRFFYMCVIIISGWNMTSIFVLMMNRFNTDSISIGVKTTYTRWTNTFPAVSICLTKNKMPQTFMHDMLQRNGVNASISYARTIYDYLFINSNDFYIKRANCEKLNSTCGVDILKLRRELLARTCDTFMTKVYFSDVLIPDCKSVFHFHEMEMGYCFLANNIIDYNKFESLPLQYSSLNNARKLQFFLKREILYRYDLYVHSPEDIPYFNAASYTISTYSVLMNINVDEIYNNVDVMNEKIHQRLCTFLTENNQNKYYSFSTCLTHVMSEMELQQCNCTLSSNTDSPLHCNIEGISCLNSGKVKDFVGSNLVCLPSCMEQQISHVGLIEKETDLKDDILVEINIASPPSARYYRTVTQTKLDLTVAIGGVLGLCIGASSLNILEIIYFSVKKIHRILLN